MREKPPELVFHGASVDPDSVVREVNAYHVVLEKIVADDAGHAWGGGEIPHLKLEGAEIVTAHSEVVEGDGLVCGVHMRGLCV